MPAAFFAIIRRYSSHVCSSPYLHFVLLLYLSFELLSISLTVVSASSSSALPLSAVSPPTATHDKGHALSRDASGPTIHTLTCDYVTVIRSDRGGRLFAVAPSRTYDPRFKAAFAADITAAVFNVTNISTSPLPSSWPSSVSALSLHSASRCHDSSPLGNDTCGSAGSDSEERTFGEPTGEMLVTRGPHFDAFFVSSYTADGTRLITCPPPGADSLAYAPGESRLSPSNGKENYVEVLQIQKKFTDKLPLIAVSFSITTNLLPDPIEVSVASSLLLSDVDGRSSLTASVAADSLSLTPSKTSTTEGEQSAQTPPSAPDTPGLPYPSKHPARKSTLLYYARIPSSTLEKHVEHDFIHSLTRRKRNSRVSPEDIYVFPNLTISEMLSIYHTTVGDGDGRKNPDRSDDNGDCHTDTEEERVVRQAVTRVEARTHTATSEPDAAAAPLRLLQSFGNRAGPLREATPAENKAALESRRAAIAWVCREDSRLGSCHDVGCAIGILCLLTIVFLIAGAVMPFLCGTCRQRRKERQDQERLQLLQGHS